MLQTNDLGHLQKVAGTLTVAIANGPTIKFPYKHWNFLVATKLIMAYYYSALSHFY
jgi:hypothetical protein